MMVASEGSAARGDQARRNLRLGIARMLRAR